MKRDPRSGIRLGLLLAAVWPGAAGLLAAVQPPLLIAPGEADVQSVARAMHRATGLPLVVVYDGRRGPRGVALDSTRRMRLQLWQGGRSEWKQWSTVAAAVGALGPSQLLIFGDESFFPESWLAGVSGRYPRIRFHDNADAVGWLNQARALEARRVAAVQAAARRQARVAEQRTTSVPPSAAPRAPTELLALPPKRTTRTRVRPGPAETTRPTEPGDRPVPADATSAAPPPGAGVGPSAAPDPGDKPVPGGKLAPAGATSAAPPAAADPDAAKPGDQAPAEPASAEPEDFPSDASAAGAAETVRADEPAGVTTPPAGATVAVAPPTAPRPDEGASGPLPYSILRERYAEAATAMKLDTGNPALPTLQSHVERTSDWAQQLQLAREGNYPNTALTAHENLEREVDRMRAALAEYREGSAAASADIAELKAEKLDFGAVEPPRDPEDQARTASELAAFRAGQLDVDDLREDPGRYAAVRIGLALEEVVERKIAAFESAARAFAR